MDRKADHFAAENLAMLLSLVVLAVAVIGATLLLSRSAGHIRLLRWVVLGLPICAVAAIFVRGLALALRRRNKTKSESTGEPKETNK
jgi:predicted RND superfamily exporter protein